VLTTSKIGVIILFAQIIILGIIFTIHYQKILQGFIITLFCLITLFGILSLSKVTVSRFNSITNISKSEKIDISSIESSSARILTWTSSIELIKENPILGVGTGDIKNELLRVYQKNKYAGALKQKLNSHNQFLQATAALGILGFISLFLMFGLPLLIAVKNKNITLLMAIIIVALFATTESVFEVQAGSVFYAFIIPILFVLSISPNKFTPCSYATHT
jgi:O-antigen ligase